MANGQQNVNFFPWDEVNEDNVLPGGVFQMRMKLEDGMSNTGKRMVRGQFTCLAPAECAGMTHFENYVLGTDEQPNGIVPGTMGTRSFKKAVKNAQVPPSNDIAQLIVSADGAELLLVLTWYKEQKGEYAGMMRNRIVDYCRLGERNVGITQPLPGQAGPQVGAGAPPMGAGPGMPGPATGATSLGPAPQASPPGLAPMQTQPAAGSTPPQPVSPAPPPGVPATQPTTPVAPPAGPQPPATPPQAPLAAAPAAGPVLRCTICQQDVPAAQFGAHVQAHATQAAQ